MTATHSQPINSEPPSRSLLTRLLASWKLRVLALILALVAIGVALSMPYLHRWQAIKYFQALDARGNDVGKFEFTEGHEERAERYGEWSLVFHPVDVVVARSATDETLRQVGSLQDAQRLILSQHEQRPLSEAGLSHLRDFDQLELLTLVGPGFTDAAIARLLESRPPLTSLYLLDTGAGEQTLARLGMIPTLDSLVILDGDITDAMFEGLSPSPILTTVRISGAGERAISWLTQSPLLFNLELRESSLTDAGVPRVQDLHALRCFAVEGAPLTSEGLRQLASLDPNPFEFLAIVDCPRISAEDIEILADMPRLRGLCLSPDLITMEGIIHLSEAPRLEYLFSTEAIGDMTLVREARLSPFYYYELATLDVLGYADAYLSRQSVVIPW